MLNLEKYAGMEQFADLVAEIRKLREVARKFAEVSELVTAEAEPLKPERIHCEEVCRTKAAEALKAYRTL